jgi:hypothetical protein
MDKEILKKGLEKYTKHALKLIVDYDIDIAVRDTHLGWNEYTVTFIFTIDHSRYWRGKWDNPNPTFDEEYNVEVSKLYMDEYLPELETSVKLFGISDPDVRTHYKHTNNSIYKPIIDFLNIDYPDEFNSHFYYAIPVLSIEFSDYIDTGEVQEQLNDEGYDTEDIAFY